MNSNDQEFLIKNNSIQVTNTAHLFTLAKELENEGQPVLHMELGDPEFSTPDVIKQTIYDELAKNNTKYEIAQGIPELRESIALYYEEKFNINLNHKNDIIITSGAKLGINLSLQSILKKHDEVIVLSPSWPTYKSIVKLLGGTIKEVNISFNANEDLKCIRQAITQKTRCILINFPNNPTSITVEPAYLRQLNDLMKAYPEIYLLSDEIYLELAYDEYNSSMIDYFTTNEKIIIVSGFSKAWAMTGFRLGYVIAQQGIILNIKEQINNTTSCVPPFIQKAGVTAMNYTEHFEGLRKTYQNRVKKIISILKNSDYVKIPFIPNASFYLFIEIKFLSKNFVLDFLYKYRICFTPGGIFGDKYQNFIRISLTNTDEVVINAINDLMTYLKETNEQH